MTLPAADTPEQYKRTADDDRSSSRVEVQTGHLPYHTRQRTTIRTPSKTTESRGGAMVRVSLASRADDSDSCALDHSRVADEEEHK